MRFAKALASTIAATCLAVAGSAVAADSFHTDISEGNYQVFTIRYDGSPPPTLDGMSTIYVYGQQPGLPKFLWDFYYSPNSCALAVSGTTTCTINPAKVTATTWNNYISLYIEFPNASVDDCAAHPGNTCALQYRPISVDLPRAFGDDTRSYEVLSQRVSAIPEPTTWAMMIVGFGLVGGALRRREKAECAL